MLRPREGYLEEDVLAALKRLESTSSFARYAEASPDSGGISARQRLAEALLGGRGWRESGFALEGCCHAAVLQHAGIFRVRVALRLQSTCVHVDLRTRPVEVYGADEVFAAVDRMFALEPPLRAEFDRLQRIRCLFEREESHDEEDWVSVEKAKYYLAALTPLAARALSAARAETLDGLKSRLAGLTRTRLREFCAVCHDLLMEKLPGFIAILEAERADLRKLLWAVGNQEMGVRAAKGAMAAASVAGTGLMFSPAAPLGIGLLVMSGGGGTITSGADIYLTRYKGGSIKDAAEKIRSGQLAIHESLQCVQGYLHVGSKEWEHALGGLSSDAIEIWQALGMGVATAHIGLEASGGFGSFVVAAQAADAWTAAQAASQAADAAKGAQFAWLPGTTAYTAAQQASTSAAAATSTAEAAQVGASAAGGVFKAVAAAGAVVSTADFVYSLATSNPNRASLVKLQKHLDDCCKLYRSVFELLMALHSEAEQQQQRLSPP